MQPKYATCNNCHAKLRLFMDEVPEKCPQCHTLLRQEEFGKCKICKAQVMLGVEKCEGCKLAQDPNYSSYPAGSPGVRGGVN